MTRRPSLFICLIWLLAAFSSVSTQSLLAATKPISVEAYRAQLEKAQSQLQKMEARPTRKVAPILSALAQDQTIRRSDGQIQAASGDEFKKLASQLTGTTTGEDTRRIRASIALRQKELDTWSRSSFASVDAQSIVKQLEESSQIRTGPTWSEQTIANVRTWCKQKFLDFVRWVGGLFPSGKAGKMPNIDLNWIRALFTLSVLALLATIGVLVWRAVGGKIGRNRKKQGGFAFSSEDDELLELPPDELRARALRFAEEGNFREALRHLYIALLLNLDARGVWRYDTRRTNWEHIAGLQEQAGRSVLVAPLSDITQRFDRVRYGNAVCGQNDWIQFERDVTNLEGKAAP